ncbi:hypothetical protein TRFO_17174 [Tritrichomonas foetus]|uniref:non-specific serine/threonine protein kinase n=1 Tax=Tritrichomonas foetus TaxID=1144522 RepID=A0A1J4KT34_9EUKA|nr:hypothetical protein TRFO_17174 [Tritrichomonas foetus]|eukprot:OHT12822.1 hypothetical protein TRFO_17174 [Tritrichomonas foetus]
MYTSISIRHQIYLIEQEIKLMKRIWRPFPLNRSSTPRLQLNLSSQASKLSSRSNHPHSISQPGNGMTSCESFHMPKVRQKSNSGTFCTSPLSQSNFSKQPPPPLHTRTCPLSYPDEIQSNSSNSQSNTRPNNASNNPHLNNNRVVSCNSFNIDTRNHRNIKNGCLSGRCVGYPPQPQVHYNTGFHSHHHRNSNKPTQLASLFQSLVVRKKSLENILFSLPKDEIQLRASIEAVATACLFQVVKRAKREAENLRQILRKNDSSGKVPNTVVSQVLSIFIHLTHLPSNLAISLANEKPESHSNCQNNSTCSNCNCSSQNASNCSCHQNNNTSRLTNHSTGNRSNSNLKNSNNNCTSSDSIDCQSVLGDGSLISGSVNNHSMPALYKSEDSSYDELETMLEDNIMSTSDDGETIICRICEKVVPLNLIEKHSKLCTQAHQAKYQFLTASDKLKRLNQKLSNQLTSQFPGEEKNAVSFLYPLLHLYYCIDNAVTVKSNNTCDGIEVLFQVYNLLINFKVPKSALQYTSLFAHAAKLVNQKLKALDDIDKASQAIAETTIDHSVWVLQDTQLSDFQFLARLSSGAFARVYLAKKEKTGDLFAIKVIKQSHANLKNQVRRVSQERDIMMQLQSPYMVNFYYSFIMKNNLYLVMEYIPGGDIYSLLQSVGCLEEKNVKTYIVQLVKALQFLRENQIIHRDLKPDNILIDSNGFLRLTDFGLSLCGLNGKQQASRVGTPDYMAPEIVLNEDNSYSCDYWSLGVITYEMLWGVPPFHGSTEDDTFKNILTMNINSSFLDAQDTQNNQEDNDFGPVSNQCKDFISKLLVSDPKQRLGSNRFEEIMDHEWFKGIDWNAINEMSPVFVPDTSSLENYQIYFQSRYQFPEDGEIDIREDLAEAAGIETLEDYATTPFDERKSILSSDSVAMLSTAFPKMSLQHLSTTNDILAKNIRTRRAASMSNSNSGRTPLSSTSSFSSVTSESVSSSEDIPFSEMTTESILGQNPP